MKQRIIEECIRLFNEKGCRFTLDDIVQSLRVSRKTIYKYFLSKDDIFKGILDEAYDDIHMKQNQIFQDDTLTISEKMLAVCTIETKYDKKINLNRIYESEQLIPEVFDYFMGKYEKGWEIVEELLVEGIKEGVFEDTSIPVVIRLLQNGMKMLCQGNFLEENKISYKEGLNKVVTIMIKGITK
ncbi:TetR/AcrR family transcriptional regulator [Anaeromicropila herbilytica]|uniref:TetR family transcriptional regulator n=1 Tax=Anaeromicropila herbilytica TaxID=2785025 RepID=A0A7R7EI72_9FIRM|nr:TetR/AcrR family transcriptional regulator [Anaeromicropila herbilytica]BCN29321.1 TetR family transcriptional regulator [Anaeromicropila herbilytica]